jgi:hypothetical protein
MLLRLSSRGHVFVSSTRDVRSRIATSVVYGMVEESADVVDEEGVEKGGYVLFVCEGESAFVRYPVDV